MQKIDSICRTNGNSNGRCVPRPAFHAVPGGTYDPLAKLIVETNGLRREGNFYIEENPEDGLGAITHIALCLSKQNWFRNYVKVLKCYRWNADTQDFDIEDAIQDMIFADFPVS